MKYLRESTSKEIGRTYPQVQTMIEEYDRNSPQSIYHSTIDGDNVENANYSGFYLEKTAKLTDLVSCAMLLPRYLLISNRVKELLGNFRLPNCSYYPAVIIDSKGQEIDNYYVLHIKSLDISIINLEQSEFEIHRGFGNFVECRKFSDYSELDSFYRNHKLSAYLYKIKFNEPAPCLDWMYFGKYTPYHILSDNLFDCLRDNKITGINYSLV